jgi:hypothetical protein
VTTLVTYQLLNTYDRTYVSNKMLSGKRGRRKNDKGKALTNISTRDRIEAQDNCGLAIHDDKNVTRLGAADAIAETSDIPTRLSAVGANVHGLREPLQVVTLLHPSHSRRHCGRLNTENGNLPFTFPSYGFSLAPFPWRTFGG